MHPTLGILQSENAGKQHKRSKRSQKLKGGATEENETVFWSCGWYWVFLNSPPVGASPQLTVKSSVFPVMFSLDDQSLLPVYWWYKVQMQLLALPFSHGWLWLFTGGGEGG